MKTQKSNAIGLKKLTIARINDRAMNALRGGSSVPTANLASYAPDNCPSDMLRLY